MVHSGFAYGLGRGARASLRITNKNEATSHCFHGLNGKLDDDKAWPIIQKIKYISHDVDDNMLHSVLSVKCKSSNLELPHDARESVGDVPFWR